MKLQRVGSAAKPHTCEKCKATIERGEPYVYFQAYRERKHIRCTKTQCQPKASELESNPKRAAIAEAQEGYAIAISADDAQTCVDSLRSAIANIESARDEFEDACNNWQGTGLENSERYSEFEDASAELSDWLDNAESVADSLDSFISEDHSEDDESWRESLDDLDEIPEVGFS